MAARLVKKTASVSLPDGSGRVAVVADTHSHPHPRIADHLASLEPTAILHAGDIGELSVLDDLARVAPVFAVRGNIDTGARQLPDVMVLDLEAGGRAMRILLIHIAVYGPKLRAEVGRLARAEKASLVVCGHSHVPFIGQDAGVTVFNPGSIGPRRFGLPIVFGTIEVGSTGVRLAHIDCETGRPWSPPG
ncbi:MAG TPA: metallophosphoesterase family protein [Kofleriaceae bacterium]|nr:metallophosphoesterase family protein [Kofleriaceae bacterium]